jgi:hypothetical protein
MLRFLSLGAGVQSSTVALMMVKGEIEPCDHAIFADTRAEGLATYKYLDWLKDQLTFPLHVVQQKNGLTKNIEDGCKPDRTYCSNPPLFVGKGGLLKRNCTKDFKITPIMRKVRELGATRKNPAVQVFGISSDEKRRMLLPRVQYVSEHKYPLIELGMSRGDCLRWMAKNNYPSPPRSACVYCPYKCNAEWEKMKNIYPADFAEAVRMDKLMRHSLPGVRGIHGHQPNSCFVHRSLKPLDEVVFWKDTGQGNLFENDCEGMCGV